MVLYNTSMLIQRSSLSVVKKGLLDFPVVALLGSRQVGKTTLAKQIIKEQGASALYFDLELPSDYLKLEEAEIYFTENKDKLIVIDEVQRRPDLFPLIRALVDQGDKPGRFLLLGSSSPDVTKQSSESLAGRVKYHVLHPFSLGEVGISQYKKLWVDGGYPKSYLASDPQVSFGWRESFIQTFLERDIPQFGIRVPAIQLRRFWIMMAHINGQLWNSGPISRSLGVANSTVKHYLDILSETYMMRQLLPYHVNVKKRLIKSQKVYFRDTGILHSLLNIPSYDLLRENSCLGASWEGFVIEQIIAVLPESNQYFFYKSVAGAEIDLVIVDRTGRLTAVEIKYSLSPRPTRGFWNACEDLGIDRAFVVYPGDDSYPINKMCRTLPVGKISLLLN